MLHEDRFKRFIRRSLVLNKLYCSIRYIYTWYSKQKSLKHSIYSNKGLGRLKRDIIGRNNSISIGENTRLSKLKIRIRGNSNSVIIKDGCAFGPDCSLWLEGDNITIVIDSGCTFTMRCHLNAQEDNSKICIGKDCMFSNHIIVRTSDSHPIYDLKTKERLNTPEPVIIGNHVWIAPNTKIMKGSVIPNGCIIGSDTTTTKAFTQENAMIVGRPAKVIKTDVEWTREQLF